VTLFGSKLTRFLEVFMRVLWLFAVTLLPFAVLAQNNDAVKTCPATEQAILDFRKSMRDAFTRKVFDAIAKQFDDDAVVSADSGKRLAWVTASPAINSPALGFVRDAGDALEVPFNDAPNRFIVAFKNNGNTPAELLDVAVVYRMIDRLADLPEDPDYGQKGSFQRLTLVKGDSVGSYAFLRPDIILQRRQAVAVQQQQSFLCAYGIITYEDAFGRPHETRFGFVYHFPLGGDPRPAGFTREGISPKYNGAT
jgi:hypothetical protein